MTNPQNVIWAMGGKGSSNNLAHAYLSEKALAENNCICGRGVKPHLIFASWDLSNELIAKHTCPQCRDRLAVLGLLRNEETE